jgi:hypothetical protein
MPLKSWRNRRPPDSPVLTRRPCVDEESASRSSQFTPEIERPLYPNGQKAGAPNAVWA